MEEPFKDYGEFENLGTERIVCVNVSRTYLRGEREVCMNVPENTGG